MDILTEEADDREEDLHRQLFDSLAGCSRQRLRALQMTLRKYGNSESRVSTKDLQQVFHESQIKMSSRTSQLLVDAFEDQGGIDYEKMWKSLVSAQEKTGRDSVLAQQCQAAVDKTQRLMSLEQKDEDLVRRLEVQLKQSREPYDLHMLAATFQKRDVSRAGKLHRKNVMDLCADHNLPVYGALLSSLMNRCDDEQTGQISWSEVMSFLEKGNKNVPSSNIDVGSKTKLASADLTIEDTTASAASNQLVTKTESDSSQQPVRSTAKIVVKVERLPSPKAELKSTTATAMKGGPATHAATKTTAKTTPPSSRKSVKPQELTLKGKKLVFYGPDGFDESRVKTEPPKERIKMDWVYGYRGNDSRNNIHVLNSGEIAYYIGVVVVLYNQGSHVQRHYREHSQEIMSMAVHPNQVTIATGQKSAVSESEQKDAYIRVWRSDTLQTIHILGAGTFQKAVICVGFSRAKERLCAVDSSKDNVLSVWDTATGDMIGKATLGVEVVCGVDFNPKNPDMIAVVGKEHLGWWLLYQDSNAIQLHSKADYQNYLRAKFVICVMHNEKGDSITGDSNGTIYVWGCGSNVITNIIKHAHDGPVLWLLLSRATLFTAGRDGAVFAFAWGRNMDLLGRLQIEKSEGGVRMLQLNSTQLLIGTTTNSILTTTLVQHESRDPFHDVTVDKIPLTQGHYDDVVALCPVRAQGKASHMLTVGSEGTVCMFDTEKRQPLWRYTLKGVRPQCADIDSTGTLLVTGSKETVCLYTVVHDVENGYLLQLVSTVRVKSALLTTLKLSPDCQKIAVGDGVNKLIHVIGMKLDEDKKTFWDLLGSGQGHTASVSGLDWSSDKYKNDYVIRSASTNAELFFWNSQTQARFSNDMLLRNLKWASHNCNLGFSVCGIWHSKQAREADITSVDVNQAQSLVAMGDGNGYISMFRYPCMKKGFYSHTYRAHQKVFLVRFSATGNAVATTGGTDATLMQWKMV